MSNARDFAARVPVDGALSSRNMVVNGACNVAQRGTVTGITSAQDNYGGPDRFAIYSNSPSFSAAFSAIQQSTGLAEFPECFRLDCTTAASGSFTGNHELKISHNIEAQNLQGVAFGTSSAKKLTLSFWCRSNQAATYALWFYRPDTSNRHTGVTYTINSANTWEHKTVTINADTTNLVDNDNGLGLGVNWIMNTGSDYTTGTAMNGTWQSLVNADRYVGHTATISASTSDYFDLTGVQLELGDTATDFEHRSYGDELARCQRYYKRFETTGAEYQGFSAGVQYISTIYLGTMTYYPEMRAAPSFSTNRLNNNDLVIVGGNNTYQISAVSITGNGQSSRLNCTSSGMTQGDGAYIQLKEGYVDFDAEL
jgi:hypothetical protein